ncbi:MAG TPA: FAD-dependent oxidoreductase [Solirubrobacteraceae bacterium]
MTTRDPSSKLRVLIAGGGVAALETLLALHALAPEQTETTMLAPNAQFVYRPMTVREPFAYPAAERYELASIVQEAGAKLVVDELGWVDPGKRMAHTSNGAEIEYDVLVLALGARICPRYAHALTIDDRKLEETFHGLIQDVEDGYVDSVAFISPGRMAWPLPLYELALLTAGRAYDMGVQLTTTIITPEDAPLAIFGSAVSDTVAQLLKAANIEMIGSAYAEVPAQGEIVINPGDRHMKAKRVVALPELYGPSIRGIPLSQHGFLRVDLHGRVSDVEHVYAAGDATDFAIKYGGIAAQQADALAESIAAEAGAAVDPQPFHPLIHGILLTAADPLYLTAHIAGGQGFSSEISDTPSWPHPAKISAKYLTPYLEQLDRARAHAHR